MKSNRAVKKILLLIFIMVGTMTLSACEIWPKEEETLDSMAVINPYEASTSKVKQGKITKEVNLKGRFVTDNTHTMAFNNRSGALINVNVKKGSIVNKGDLIAEIDSRGLNNEIKRQEMEIKKFEEAYNRALKNNSGESKLKQAELDLQIEKLKLRSMDKQYNKFKLTSPIDGKVIKLTSKIKGENVNVKEDIVTITDIKDVYIECDVLDKTINDIKHGMITKGTYKNKEYLGEIVEVIATAPANSETHKNPYIRIKLQNSNSEAPIGEETEVKFQLTNRENVILIPKICTMIKGKSTVVYVVKDGNKVEKDVVLGIDNDDFVEVVNGLSEGEEILELR